VPGRKRGERRVTNRAVPFVLLFLVAVAGTIGALVGAFQSPTVPPPVNQGIERALLAPRWLPPARNGCALKSGPSIGPRSVSLREDRAGPAVWLIAPVCLDGQGPFPFVLDTGSSISVIDSRVAQRLRLHAVGPKQQGFGAACPVRLSPVQVASWSVGDLSLFPQSLQSTHIPGFGGPGALSGVLGSDVLSRFGMVSIDYDRPSLTVLDPEGPILRDGVFRASPPPPNSRTPRASGPTIPLTVVASGGSVVASVAMRVGVHSDPFVVDTGAAITSISSTLASDWRLQQTGSPVQLPTISCYFTAGFVNSGPWAMGAVSLPPQQLATLPLPVGGVLGSDVFARLGVISLDYQRHTLTLGPGTHVTVRSKSEPVR
jgi:hypothetical protein